MSAEGHGFDLARFLPYLLNLAAEEAGAGFQRVYKDRYGMLRAEWRVLVHLGRQDGLTARQIADRSRTHKTKVSRAVAALEARRFLQRRSDPADRRREALALTPLGLAAYRDLTATAAAYDEGLAAALDPGEAEVLRRALRRLARL